MKALEKVILEQIKFGVERAGYTMDDVPEMITVERILIADNNLQYRIDFQLDGKKFTCVMPFLTLLDDVNDVSSFEIKTK